MSGLFFSQKEYLVFKMTKKLSLLFISLAFSSLSFGQRSTYQDEYLAHSFRVYQEADIDMAHHIFPFIQSRFNAELEKASSFTNPFDSLSKYIKVIWSADSLVKLYSWYQRDWGCCYSFENHAQFRSRSGVIQHMDLSENIESDHSFTFNEIHVVPNNQSPLYLILGWGSCCGGKQYEIAQAYQIKDGMLVLVNGAFDDIGSQLSIGANRNQEVQMSYSSETRTLTYTKREFDGNSGFYSDVQTQVEWKFNDEGQAKRVNEE